MELDDRTRTLDDLYKALDELERMRLDVVEKILALGGEVKPYVVEPPDEHYP